MDLKGVVALVTGGNGGLGQRICHARARRRAHMSPSCTLAAATRSPAN
jgi:3-oxoacyl-[acyl-carrier protein] reductase